MCNAFTILSTKHIRYHIYIKSPVRGPPRIQPPNYSNFVIISRYFNPPRIALRIKQADNNELRFIIHRTFCVSTDIRDNRILTRAECRPHAPPRSLTDNNVFSFHIAYQSCRCWCSAKRSELRLRLKVTSVIDLCNFSRSETYIRHTFCLVSSGVGIVVPIHQ